MKKDLMILLLLGMAVLSRAEEFPRYGTDSVSANFFRQWYHYGDMTHYLDNYSDYVIYESETTGEWAHTDPLVFSVSGNSFKQSKFEFEGFRIDSRLHAGSTMFRQNLQETDLSLDYHAGMLSLHRADDAMSYVRLSGNIGQLGGISPGTRQLINLFHTAATERVLDKRPEQYRPYIAGAGSAEMGYQVKMFDRQFYQHLFVEIGERRAPEWDQNGITTMSRSLNYTLQADGMIPLRQTAPIRNLQYMLGFLSRDDAFSEFLYNGDEQARERVYSAALFMNDTLNGGHRLNTGLSLEMQDLKHRSLFFSRNVIDQDGEGFEPWYTDGLTTALNWSVKYSKEWDNGLSVNLKAYNSLLHHKPYTTAWANQVYVQPMNESATSLYDIEWTARSFTSSLLENTATLDYRYRPTEKFGLHAYAGMSLDGMLMRDKSLVSPNLVAGLMMDIEPCQWFHIDINMSHNRQTYTIDDVRYFSNDYMNGVARLGNDNILTSGGMYHHYAKGLGWTQPAYFVLDLPFRFTFGKRVEHEISFLQQGRIYYNQWTTNFMDGIAANGQYDADNIFFFSPKSEREYEVGLLPSERMSDKWIMSNPYYLSSVIKYALRSKHVLFSVSWQSFLMCGPSALGNGVLHNNIGILSESQANPNTWRTETNLVGAYPAHGRVDQDRAYIARVMLSYNICQYLSLTFNAKFKDGVPFSNFKHKLLIDPTLGRQVAVWNDDTKGINLTDNHFGKREDAFFDFDLRLTGTWSIKDRQYELLAVCYNIYDFGTALTEYTFDDKIYETRTTMSLCIPRGLIVSLKVGL